MATWKKYRKKPIVVEACRWESGQLKDIVQEFTAGPNEWLSFCEICGKSIAWHGIIKTLEGPHWVCPGDYIVKGIKGEYYPVKPDIFKETHEEVEE